MSLPRRSMLLMITALLVHGVYTPVLAESGNISINTISPHVAGDPFEISGTTRIPDSDILQVSVYPSRMYDPVKAFASLEKAGTTEIWILPSDQNPDSQYTVTKREQNGTVTSFSYDIPQSESHYVTPVRKNLDGESTWSIRFTGTNDMGEILPPDSYAVVVEGGSGERKEVTDRSFVLT